ncbi:MAG: oxidoreductase [Ruminococcaceae bacterium]|nr:oxidoreductase [Oscillospiraceae bacterium]
MITTTFKGKTLPMLGLGAMRLPMNPDKTIDKLQTAEMIRLAMASGLNYFDTAYPYHGGLSEVVLCEILREYPRESWYLADKYPGHQISSTYNPAEIFEDQLKKCGVEYFDFYLLHNVYENSMDVYMDEKWGIIDYFRRQRELGRIRHLGFSTHAAPDTIEKFLTLCPDMEFCQIQLNWLDWTLQDAKRTVAILNAKNVPIWVMEPLRGGKLCRLSDEDEAALKVMRPEESIPGWSFRFVQDVPGVAMILSGMSEVSQLTENLAVFAEKKPLTDAEREKLFEIAEGMKDSVPCTGCGYCLAECPKSLDIPRMMTTYNEIRIMPNTNAVMYLETASSDRWPSACISCGKCAKICPQSIDIPTVMKDFAERFDKIPKWTEISREREELARKLKEANK